MDLGGGFTTSPVWDRVHHTKTITLQSDLYVDQLSMDGGTIDGNKKLVIWQQTTDPARRATSFGTSWFFRARSSPTWRRRGNEHRVTLNLGYAGDADFQANMDVDAFSTVNWTKGDVTVSPGKTITNNGSFLADSATAGGGKQVRQPTAAAWRPGESLDFVNKGKVYWARAASRTSGSR
jgi:hypothetical protein